MRGEPQPTLAALHNEMRGCRHCIDAGYAIAPGAVFSGSDHATVMLIGQAPGITEAEVKRPFNAGSGRRLFQWLGAAGWQEDSFRKRQYMTAVTKCYPGRSTSGKGDRVPSKREQALCRAYLEHELRIIKPRLLIPVGGLAIKLFYPAKARLVDIIGTISYFPREILTDPECFHSAETHQVSDFDPALDQRGCWLVPLPHPSGASLWPNKAENRILIERAIQMLGEIREGWNLSAVDDAAPKEV